MPTCSPISEILNELTQALQAVGAQQMEVLADAVAAADRVFLTGQGRSRLMVAAFANRLVHLGRRAHVVGEPTVPAADRSSLLIACSGSGRTRSTVIHAQQARAVGAQVWAITQDSSSSLAIAADHVIAIPPLPSLQPGRAAFEQALLVLLDAVVMRLMAKLGETADTMLSRHANLE